MPWSLPFKYIALLFPWVMTFCLMLLFPEQSISSALQGIAIWWEVLFPALFPFFVISELLLGIGMVHFIGGLFDPMMRPMFRIPGYGGFVMAMGFAAGYPVSARLTSQLWNKRLIHREEAERLVAFTSTSDPIFLIGAVAVGFFHDPGLALVLALSHYGGGLILGFIMRFHGQDVSHHDKPKETKQAFIVSRAFQAMHEARIQDGRTLGLMLQQSIQTSIKLVFTIGGLVVFVSVLIQLLSVVGIMDMLYWIFAYALMLTSLPPVLSPSLVNGFFEVTLGVKAAGEAAVSIALVHKVAMASFVLSWAGLCVHAQITSLLSQTDLRYSPFVIARFLHGVIAMILVYLLWTPTESLRLAFGDAIPVNLTTGFVPSFQLGIMLMVGLALSTLLIIPICYIIFITIRRLFLLLKRSQS